MITKYPQIALIFTLILAGCSGYAPEPAGAQAAPMTTPEVVVWSWPEDSIPQVMEAFSQEYNVRVVFETYPSQEEAIAQISAGKRADLVVMDNQLIAAMIARGLLRRINSLGLPNLKHINPQYLAPPFDLENHYSVPYSWGTTGLLVRTDLAGRPVQRWADLWDRQFAGKRVLWSSTPRHTAAIALKALGYSINTESPLELEAAILKLAEIKDSTLWMGEDVETCAEWLTGGQAILAEGWAYDATVAQETNASVAYIMPQDGAILWGDSFVIPITSAEPQLGELFLNYLLRPEVSAQLMNLNYYPMPNEAALPLIDAELLNDVIVFPALDSLPNAETLQPFSPQGQKLFDAIWERYLGALQ